MTKLQWATGKNGHYRLDSLIFSRIQTAGVYVIWQSGGMLYRPTIIRVGQGDIGNRLQAHLNDTAVNRYNTQGNPLYVTWAEAGLLVRDGVERYLAETYRPLVGDRFPDAPRLVVNLPV